MLYRFILLLTLSFTLLTQAHAEGPFLWPQTDWKNLDVGIYWVGPNNIYCKANPESWQDISPACKKMPFDPKKPTVIFVHGYEPLSVHYRTRFDFYILGKTYLEPSDVGYNKQWDLAKAWRDKGWNVGIFYWNQLSDTDMPYTAEDKIWKKATWWKGIDKQGNVIVHDSCTWHGKPCSSVANMLLSSYLQAMKNYQGNNIRIIGHSLGGQLSIHFIYLLSKQVEAGKVSPKLLPKRLALLDPYFSEPLDATKNTENAENSNALFPKTYREIASDELVHLIKHDGLITAMYLSSGLTSADQYGELPDFVANEWFEIDFPNKFSQLTKHSSAWIEYLLSFADKPPAQYLDYNYLALNGKAAPSAATSDFRIAEMMGGYYLWDQIDGTMTLETSKDAFLIEKRKWFSSYRPGKQIKFTIKIIKMPNPHASVAALKNQNKNELYLPVGSEIKINAKVLPKGANNKIVLWQSSDPQAVSVYPGGFVMVNAKSNKPVVLTASAPSGRLNKNEAAGAVIQKQMTINIVG